MALATALASGALAATAHAQFDLLQDPGEKTGVDTYATPVPRQLPDGVWQQLGGARFGAEQVRPDSSTPFDADLYKLSFRSVKSGFFAGAQCRRADPEEPFDGKRLLDLRRAGEDCERIPVIYEFTDRDDEGPIVRESWRGEDSTDPGGYVGAVAWLNNGRALAVGGDGEYVRRDLSTIADPDTDDPAGKARAWLYETDPATKRGAWREITHTEKLLPGMRGMQALGTNPPESIPFNPNERPQGVKPDHPYDREVAWAGAYRQLWQWEGDAEGGRFTKSAGDPGYRVRSIGFVGHYGASYDSDGDGQAEQYSYRLPHVVGGGHFSFSHTTIVAGPACNGSSPIESCRLTVRGPDGPKPPPSDPLRYPEPTPLVFLGCCPSANLDGRDKEWPTRNSYRLAAAELTSGLRTDFQFQDQLGWTAVGNLRSGQAAMLTRRPVPCYLNSGCYQSNLPNDTPESYQERELRSRLYKLDTYALNWIAGVRFQGVTWAVGDHGAILRQGGSGSLVADEPRPPALRPGQETRLSDRSPYDSFREPAASEDVGGLPPLRARPLERLPEPRFVPSAAPDQGEPSTIVMSRDGRRGWGFTGSGTLYRFDGAFWQVCDADGDPAYGIAPDPECAGAKPKVPDGVAVRIPYENDAEPNNDDRFEVLAGGFRFGVQDDEDWRRGKPRWLPGYGRYGRPGAFTSPTEGWAAGGFQGTGGLSNQGKRQLPNIAYFNGTQWTECPAGYGTRVQFPPPPPPPNYKGSMACFDPDARLPFWTTESYSANPDSVHVLAVGKRVYLYGTRAPENADGDPDPAGRRSPLVIYRDTNEPCTKSGDPGCWRADPGADTGYTTTPAYPDDADQGRLKGLSVSKAPDGSYGGWAIVDLPDSTRVLYRLWPERDKEKAELGGRLFARWREPNGGPVKDYGLMPDEYGGGEKPALLSLRQGGEERAVALSSYRSGYGYGGIRLPLGFDPAQNHWTLFRGATHNNWSQLAPDGRDGFWLGLGLHYASEAPKPVFEEVGHPIKEKITDIAGAEDGTLLVATDKNVVYRYDRIGGFERLALPNWEPGRLSTGGASGVSAVAVGRDGNGIAVGRAGRIANLSPQGARLDRASGRLCEQVARAPCGTGRDLVAAAVAPDGSALVAGTGAALLWRPAGSDFRRIRRPAVQGTATFTDIAFPTPERAYVTSSAGQIYRGEYRGEGEWSWLIENLDAQGDLITRIGDQKVVSLSTLAVGADGHGYATGSIHRWTGEGGELYERAGSGQSAWTRVRPGFKLQTAAVARGQGQAAAFGGEGFIVTERAGRYELAQIGVPGTPKLELLPGVEPGQLEAWAASSDRILHYASDPSEPLLNPQARAEPLPDTPPPRQGETVFAAFGKSDCSYLYSSSACPPLLTTNNVTGRIVDELVERSKRPGGPRFALFTGDASDAANTEGTQGTGAQHLAGINDPPSESSLNHRRWRELVADYLTARELPLFAALGGQDLSATEYCDSSAIGSGTCQGTRSYADNPGLNLAWRLATASAPRPWGVGEAARSGALRFEPVPDSLATEQAEKAKPERPPDARDDDQSLAYDLLAEKPPCTANSGCSGNQAGDPQYELARNTANGALKGLGAPGRSRLYDALHSARTHYAFDVCRGDCAPRTRFARVVVVDSSLRSLSVADPVQSPPEPKAGQAGWLSDVLCEQGELTSAGSECTREPGEPAIVVSNSPSYSYGPGQGDIDPDKYYDAGRFQRTLSPQAIVNPPDTQLDPTTFETILMQHRAAVAVSGRVGWNGLYYATAPGVHEPCPGGSYPTEPPPRASAASPRARWATPSRRPAPPRRRCRMRSRAPVPRCRRRRRGRSAPPVA